MNDTLSETGDPWLLTPGPLTTSLSVKRAMLHDWGSRDRSFIDMTARIRGKLTDMAEARGRRYAENCRVLIRGMREMGFRPLLSDDLQAPIIVTFHLPSDPSFEFEEFYRRIAERGFLIYPGKLTAAPTFRIGCIGRLGAAEMEGALDAVREAAAGMGYDASL